MTEGVKKVAGEKCHRHTLEPRTARVNAINGWGGEFLSCVSALPNTSHSTPVKLSLSYVKRLTA
jgi:hypothetical protein